MRIICYLVFLLIFSCQEYSESNQSLDYFYPIKKFLIKEKDNKSGKVTVLKTVDYNGRSDTKTIENFSLEPDLQSFLDSDINKASLTDKYKGDTIVQQQTKIYEYTSLKDNLKTKKIKVSLINDEVQEIKIINNGNSVLRAFEEILVYKPNEGYEIMFDQKLTKSDPTKANIKVKFQ